MPVSRQTSHSWLVTWRVRGQRVPGFSAAHSRPSLAAPALPFRSRLSGSESSGRLRQEALPPLRSRLQRPRRFQLLTAGLMHRTQSFWQVELPAGCLPVLNLFGCRPGVFRAPPDAAASHLAQPGVSWTTAIPVSAVVPRLWPRLPIGPLTAGRLTTTLLATLRSAGPKPLAQPYGLGKAVRPGSAFPDAPEARRRPPQLPRQARPSARLARQTCALPANLSRPSTESAWPDPLAYRPQPEPPPGPQPEAPARSAGGSLHSTPGARARRRVRSPKAPARQKPSARPRRDVLAGIRFAPPKPASVEPPAAGHARSGARFWGLQSSSLVFSQRFLRPHRVSEPFPQGTFSPRNLAPTASVNSTECRARRFPALPSPGRGSFRGRAAPPECA